MKKFALLLCSLLISQPVFAAARFTHSEVSVTSSSTQVLPLNLSRVYLLIQNKGSATVYVSFDGAKSSTDGVAIPANGNYEPFVAPVDAVHVHAASGTQAIIVVEGK